MLHPRRMLPSSLFCDELTAILMAERCRWTLDPTKAHFCPFLEPHLYERCQHFIAFLCLLQIGLSTVNCLTSQLPACCGVGLIVGLVSRFQVPYLVVTGKPSEASTCSFTVSHKITSSHRYPSIQCLLLAQGGKGHAQHTNT